MAHAARMCGLLELLHQRLQEGLDRMRPFERKDLMNQLLQVARAVDHSVASNQRPNAPQRVFDIIKMITKLKDDDQMKPSMMVFLLAIKGACRSGWFKQSEADELLSLYDQLFDYFQLDGECWRQLTAGGSGTEGNSFAASLISTVCERYCPRMKLVLVIISFTTKQQYETRGCDFIVSQLAAKTKLSLFVVQIDNMETSACLVTPNSLSFVINGRGVERRSALQNSPETGPQMPSDVTLLLRLGNNFIQVVGECPGKYVIAIATTSIVQCSSACVDLKDYVVPSMAGDCADDEVIEAGSRVSLRCPISHKRIRTPVKGLLCRHHQCFDFDSFIELNELRPVWRCPCCNSNINCSQLRLDKKMRQILKDVDENYSEAIVHQDGSWVPAQSSDGLKEYSSRNTSSAVGAEACVSDHSTGPDTRMSDDGVINLTDGDDFGEPVVHLEKSISPRGEIVTFVGNVPGGSLEGPEDRKPDIGAIAGPNVLANPPTTTCTLNRERVEISPAFIPSTEASTQTGVPGNRLRGLPDAGIRPVVQNSVPTTHLWSGTGPIYASSLPGVSQQSGNRVSSFDRSGYVPATVVQALPAPNHLISQRARASPPASVISGIPANDGFVDATIQRHTVYMPPVQLGPDQVFQQDVLYQQQQAHDLLRQMQLNSNAFRAPMELDASQRTQRRGPLNGVGLQQCVVSNEQGLAREVQMQQFSTGSPSMAELSQHNQNYPHLGQNPNLMRQDFWQSQLQYQHYQQAVMNNTNSRIPAGGRSPSSNGMLFLSSSSVTAGSSHQASNSRLNPRGNSFGSGNMTPPPVVPASKATGVTPIQPTSWRPAGRMRGAVSGGFLGGNRVVNPVPTQPGPMNRTRISAASSTSSLPQSNTTNLTSANSIISSSLVQPSSILSVPTTEAIRASTFNAVRPSDEFSVSDTLFTSAMTSGDMLQDWLPSIGPDQVDSSGPQDVDRWFDEALFTHSSQAI